MEGSEVEIVAVRVGALASRACSMMVGVSSCACPAVVAPAAGRRAEERVKGRESFCRQGAGRVGARTGTGEWWRVLR